MGEEEQALHIAALLSRRIQDGQDEQMTAVRHKKDEEAAAAAAAAHGALREHGSFQQQMVVVMAPAACRARGARSRY
jgi:hypothetical protein